MQSYGTVWVFGEEINHRSRDFPVKKINSNNTRKITAYLVKIQILKIKHNLKTLLFNSL